MDLTRFADWVTIIRVEHLPERTETGGPNNRIVPDCGPCVAAIAGSYINLTSIMISRIALKRNLFYNVKYV